MNISLKKRLIVCFVGVLLTLCFHYFISEQMEFVTYSNGYFRILDYAYYIIIAKAFWFEGFGNIYEIYFNQQALSMHIGAKIYYVMPLGTTPIALVGWLPFAYIARFSMALSYTLWITSSVSVLLFSLWTVGRYVLQIKNIPILPIMLSFVTVFSVTTFFTIILGQTSILATGLLIHLIYIVHKADDKSRPGNELPIVLLIIALGIKPTYLAIGLGLLIIYGMWRQILFSGASILTIFLLVTPMLTMGWVSSYFHQLRVFSHGEIPSVYAWAFCPQTMNIFRSASRSIIGDNIANVISHIVTCSVYLGVVVFSILSRIIGKSTDQLTPSRITKGQLIVLIIGSYLLFAPYAGGYEDVLFLPIFITVLLYGNTPPLTNYKSIALVLFLFVILIHNIFPLDKPLWLLWLLKALILGYMLNFCRRG